VRHRIPRVLLLDGPRQLRLADQPPREVRPRDVRVSALVSGISHGTELSLYRGSSAFDDRLFDRELRAFVHRSDGRSSYPVTLGYEMVGRIDEVGDEVTEFSPGQLVHAGASHGEQVVIDVDATATTTYPLVALPDRSGSLDRWLFVSLGAVALLAVQDAQIKIGDHVVVVGLGAIGLLVVQLSRLAGASRVTAFDPLASRRALAERLGADAVIDPTQTVDGAGPESKRLGGGADVAIETSGVNAGVHDAIASVGMGSRIVTLGFYQGAACDVRLGEEWHHNRLELISSMGAWGNIHRHHPAWDRSRVMRTVVDLLHSDRLKVDAFPVRRFAFEDVISAYTWLDEHPGDALKVALAYENTKGGDQ
jgi:2-desacetyl-2-hydroxyethyl bacteriochlorophyllide A dehydrogenase